MELIAREALKSKLQKNIEELADKTGFFEGIRMGYESAVHFVEQAPTVEERKRGHWINPKAWHVECSECHHVLEFICDVKKYCPNCGAKMEGE
jgi:hypothetical protein